MLARIKFINEEVGQVRIMAQGSNEVWAMQNGYSAQLYDVEQAYDGQWYLAGYAPAEPEPTTEELADSVRTERDARITACDWVIMRHRDELDDGEETTLSADEYAAWLAYRRALRDLPDAEGFPWSGGGADDEDCPWPNVPSA